MINRASKPLPWWTNPTRTHSRSIFFSPAPARMQRCMRACLTLTLRQLRHHRPLQHRPHLHLHLHLHQHQHQHQQYHLHQHQHQHQHQHLHQQYHPHRTPRPVPLHSTRRHSGSMPTTRSAKAKSISHQERTASEPRSHELHRATVRQVTEVNDRIKTFRFDIVDKNGFNFLPGQWLDVFVPDTDKAGGFTITSSPKDALPQGDPDHAPFFELAVQNSPDNPPAAWLWQPVEQLVGKQIDVRVGGNFVFPPPGLDMNKPKIKRAIFIAGGVGINPMMSMMYYINQNYPNLEVRLLYSTKVPSKETSQEEVLFLPQIIDLFRIPRSESTKDRIELFFTGTWDGSEVNQSNDQPIQPLMSLTLPNLDSATEVPVIAWTHRINDIALSSAVGNKEEAKSTVFYVCGPPTMTDEIVQYLKEQDNVVPERVLCEKWW
ncbi:uncharacterized protein EKO05_0004539 [Ascochyta rabiei]|uniref:uncharacterized protein n=1 Tax=Didymella rabiei TaxID=5454 RepID=UPI0021FEC3BE|nr:uncharacterized protein EKO05_0004539 [Ascochyta rabiei]UPX14047.1 hypothetical protein EKO05_0004539 [Ascochyta rabiei]